MASAVDEHGDGVILFGVPCEYPMSDGNKSMAVVVGLSTKYMGEVLFLDADSSLTYSLLYEKTAAMLSGMKVMLLKIILTGFMVFLMIKARRLLLILNR